MSLTLQAKAKLGRWDDRYLNGHAKPNPATCRFIRRAVAKGLYCTSTTGGKHAPKSYHYVRRAADVAGSYRDMRRFYIQEVKRELRGGGTQYLELFGPGKSYIKNGRRFKGQFPGHRDHVHGAPKGWA